MVHASVSVSVEPSSTKPLYEVWPPALPGGRLLPTRVAPPKPLRADEPVKQSGVLDPRGVTAGGRRRPGGFETSVGSGRRPPTASATV